MNITTEEDEEGDEKAQAEKGQLDDFIEGVSEYRGRGESSHVFAGDNVGESGLRRRRSSIAKAAAQQFRRRWNLGDESGVKSNRPSFRRIDEVSGEEDDEMRVITFSD
ncbi:hypothetical protein FOZ63_031384 [Perkinsus olseni]|uniref:Uncharacterized protein n=2 Tax=Perkinsus olseni TaxID=32597 RepID=A0A7J6TLS1_PEROL|nr:hypothetical protein FOZ63_031384 [Perkinsus olseni]